MKVGMIYNLVMNTKNQDSLAHKASHLNLESYSSQASVSPSAFPAVKSAKPLRYTKSATVNHHYNFFESDSGPPGLEFEIQDDLFKKIRWVLVFGRFIGVVPCKGALQSDYRQFKFAIPSCAAVYSIIGACGLILSSILGIIGMTRETKNNASELAWASADPIYYCLGAYTYIFFITRGKQFSRLFESWSKMTFNFPTVDKSLCLHTAVIFGIIMTSAILENIAWTCTFLNSTKKTILKGTTDMSNSTSPLESYYTKGHRYWAQSIPYNPSIAIIGFFCNKICIYTWNFTDILIGIFSRAIYMKFKQLYDTVSEIMSTDVESGSGKEWGRDFQISWSHIIQDHTTLCDILYEFQLFLSPLIFASYARNIFFACLQLLLEFSPQHDPTFIESLYITWAFIHLLIRSFVMSLLAAKINVYAHKFRFLLEKCPIQLYTSEMERFERKLHLTEIGFHGLGCFKITNPFILGIIGVVLTFEIVLLQSLPHNSGVLSSNYTKVTKS